MGYNLAKITMKKQILLYTFLVLCYIVKSQETIGTFSMDYFSENNMKVECTNPDDANFRIFIDAMGEHKSDKVNLVLDGDDLGSFINSLIQLRNKFVEWEKVAKDNNVTDMSKEFDISLPRIGVGWYGSKWWFALRQKFTPNFMVFKDGKCAMVLYKKVTASTNEYIDQEVYFVLSSKEEFDELLGLLDVQKMREIFNKKGSAEDLFK